MGAFSTGLMLMGMALIYGSSGSFSLDMLLAGKKELTPLMASGLLLLLFSMSFKVSAAPFHFWTPDVYDGAPTVFTGYMASVVKAAAFIAFYRLFSEGFSLFHGKWDLLAAIITAATLLFGNITAVFQQSVKRMMAYSSIAQAGFMMLALVALNTRAQEGLIFYVTVYSMATIGFFSVLLKMKDFTFEGFSGLGKREPLVAGATLVFLFSLAGIPGTAGFIAKFYLLAATIEHASMLWLVILAVLCAAISVYYYFRVVQAMYFKSSDGMDSLPVDGRFRILILVLAALIILLGIFPQLLIDRIYLIF
jgi:NADH-quinone oxidoreductase subunit N